MTQMLFILSYMKARAAGTWVTHKIQQVLSPSKTPMMMDEFEAKVNLMFTDPNQEMIEWYSITAINLADDSCLSFTFRVAWF